MRFCASAAVHYKHQQQFAIQLRFRAGRSLNATPAQSPVRYMHPIHFVEIITILRPLAKLFNSQGGKPFSEFLRKQIQIKKATVQVAFFIWKYCFIV
jgi:hypothetical protein